MNNINKYFEKNNIKQSDVIINSLNDNTLISGSIILQCIYGDTYETTKIPLDFYYKEYMEIENNITKEELINKNFLEEKHIYSMKAYPVTEEGEF